MDRIVIAGGGFGGLYTALQLQKFPGARAVTLVDRQEHFVFTPLLYELVSKELDAWEIAPTFRDLLAGTGVEFVQGEVADLDLEGQKVLLSDGTDLGWDQLVIAVGGRTPTEIVSGATAFALPFRTLSDAQKLNQRLAQWETEGREDVRVAIVGAGSSGVELACKLADRLGSRGRITLIERLPEALKDAPELRSIALKELKERDITLKLSTTVERVEATQIFFSRAGQEVRPLTTDLVLWTVGTAPPLLLAGMGVKKDRIGRLVTRPTLQLEDHPRVFALGDSANSGQNLPVTAQVALQQADYCAWNLWANRMHLPLLEFQYTSLGQMMSLGIGQAAAQLVGGIIVEGAVAANLRRLIYLARMPGIPHQARVGFNWLTQPLQNLLPA
ncbi:NAD(P)/FAD-dependent oxidoreductase [Anthocerotibacter panamensis]|uniref:NAD(P)/FAD-dependent oxidoreductase n=1 Tax=Anthocerotibacter panamensis TaxID=2857077 RepID=UPI001C4071C5|nr:NAD(P)/FAD-dependent oxidoreductase [Anthocerotibacter panamensis]